MAANTTAGFRSPALTPAASVLATGGGADGPRLHLSFSEQGVDQGSQHVDGSGDVKNRLPFFQSVLGIFSTTNRESGTGNTGRKSPSELEKLDPMTKAKT